MRNEPIWGHRLRKAVAWAILAGLLLPSRSFATGPPPVIMVQPVSQNVPLWGYVTFSVTASSGTRMSYQWYLNGSAIYGANSSSYTIYSVLSLSAGNYCVQVSNSGGWVLSDNATLNVVAPPAIITQPQSQTVLRNQNATFSVVASGTGPLSYQWFFNGASLGMGGTNATLTLLNVKVSQAGAYMVVMTNSMGSVTSDVATLTVLVVFGHSQRDYADQLSMDVQWQASGRRNHVHADTPQCSDRSSRQLHRARDEHCRVGSQRHGKPGCGPPHGNSFARFCFADHSPGVHVSGVHASWAHLRRPRLE